MKGPLGKMESTWKEGVYLGVVGMSGELVIGSDEGITRTRTVHRRVVERRWGPQNVDKIKWATWKAEKEDG